MTAPSHERFPRAFRIRRRAEYQKVYESGARVSGSLLVLFVLPRTEGGPRVGLTATRKIGGAAARNRARRRVREAFRRHRDLLGPWDMVINIRQAAVGSDFPAIETEFVALTTRARRRLMQRAPGEPERC